MLANILNSPYSIQALVVIFIVIFFLVRYFQKKKRSLEEKMTSFSSIRTSHVSATTQTTAEPADFVSQIGEAIGITDLSVKIALGIPIQGSCTAGTAGEAEEAFHAAEEDSDEWYNALKRWIELETDIERMEEIYDLTDGYLPLTELIEKKWDGYSKELLNGTDTAEKIIDAFENLSNNIENDAIKKLYAIYRK